MRERIKIGAPIRRDLVRRSGATIVMLGVVIGLTSAALAAETADDLQAAADALKARQGAIEQGREQSAALGDQAQTYRSELGGLRRDTIAVAAKTQSLERALGELEARLASLGIEEAERRAALTAGRSAHGNTLSAMLRLSRRPPQALLLAPQSAVDATRSALLLAAVSRGLDAEARRIQSVLAEIDEVRNAIARDEAQLKLTEAELARERAVLESLIVRKAALERVTEAERLAAEARVALLVGEAKTLEELVTKLEAERVSAAAAPLPPPAKPTGTAPSAQPDGAPSALTDGAPSAPADTVVATPSEPGPEAAVTLAALDNEAMRAAATPKEGTFAQPVEGAIITLFGAETAPGVSARGVTFEVRPAAPVVAPFAGKVVFAGPFRQYGLLLIIAHGEGYHSLLAGLDRIDVGLGRWVLAGEPIGAMGTYSDTRPQLYLELRHKGRPVNPVPWLAIGPNQSSGS